MALPAPLVSECAWHPQYFGFRQYRILVPIPRGISREEFVEEARRQHAITHGLCDDCQALVQRDIAARRGQNRRRLR